MKRKVRRLRTLGGHFGRKALKVFVSGPLPGCIYGAEVTGMTSTEILELRGLAASVVEPSSGSRSLTVLSLLDGGPA
eukprot:6177383-Pyramimonas_sp.AAC.1